MRPQPNPLNARLTRLEKTVALYGTLLLLLYLPIIIGGIGVAVLYLKGNR